MLFSFAMLALVGSASSTILWDGRFNDMISSTDLNDWSFSNEVGSYQYYIHGSENVTSYVNLSSDYKNPADTGSTKGAKITLDSTAYWNGQTMRRTELIPQTTAAIGEGKVWYHFSVSKSDTNEPSIYREHQICFFESHFTELKSGWISGESGTSDPLLRWDVSGTTYWNVTWEPDVWHNVAYEIDFTTGSVAFWHSTNSDALTLTVAAVSVSASSNGADWHLGILELPMSGVADTDEDFFFSGVYIEDGSLTTSVAGPGGVVDLSSVSPIRSFASTITKASISSTGTTLISTTKSDMTTSRVATTSSVTTSSVAVTTSAAAGSLTKGSQCGGENWAGFGMCVVGTTCTYSNDCYSLCL